MKSARVLKFEFPLLFKFEQLTQASLPKVNLEVDYVRLEVEIKLVGIIAALIKSAPLDGTGAQNGQAKNGSSARLIYSHAMLDRLIQLRALPIVAVNVSDIKVEVYADVESKTLELSLDTVRIVKSAKEIEIVEIGRRHNRAQSRFKPAWTGESMGAVERTVLEVALNKVELKTDELEKAIFQATYLRGVFEISNKHELPLCVAIFLQSNQLVSNFDFHEFATWLQ